MKYRRFYQPGGTYFFTLVTFNPMEIFLEDSACDLFTQAISYVRNNHPFQAKAYCICLDHIHMVWSLSEDDYDYPTRWRLVKSCFCRNYRKENRISGPVSRKVGENRAIWQRRYWEHWIRDKDDLVKHIEYIHYNPVKHGLVDAPEKWKYSSFQDYVDQGLYQRDWGAQGDFKYLDAFGNE